MTKCDYCKKDFFMKDLVFVDPYKVCDDCFRYVYKKSIKRKVKG